MGSHFTTSTVRGTHVAGQTNPEPNKEHPSGHSWKDQSCKNIDTGKHKPHLPHEIKHGTILHRVHDHDGKEIYRATLQPHHNEHGHVAYDVNSEYGVNHPAFTKSSHEITTKLSTGPKNTIYKIHDKVYNNRPDDYKGMYVLHPNVSTEDLTNFQSHKDKDVRHTAIQHPLTTKEHLTHALNDPDKDIRDVAKHRLAMTKPNH